MAGITCKDGKEGHKSTSGEDDCQGKRPPGQYEEGYKRSRRYKKRLTTYHLRCVTFDISVSWGYAVLGLLLGVAFVEFPVRLENDTPGIASMWNLHSVVCFLLHNSNIAPDYSVGWVCLAS